MNASWTQINDIFHQALTLPIQVRHEFVASSCAGSVSEIDELDRLLRRAADDTDNRLMMPIGVNVRKCLECDFTSAPHNESDGSDTFAAREIGPYRLVRLIGSGGMGAVYLAERKDQFRQQVALKLLQRDRAANQSIVRRFEFERQVLSELRHENIAQLFDGGSTEVGEPYFVMEYVVGKRMTAYCDDEMLDVNNRLRLFQKVCRAVSHAHRMGVIHRDLKPANILITPEGVPKLVDFGIAKLTEMEAFNRDVTLTDTGLSPLTPAYASPEQFKAEPVGVASDVYSLGVILYELLVGQRPFEAGNRAAHDLARSVCEDEPTWPSAVAARGAGALMRTASSPAATARSTDSKRLSRQLRRELDYIVLKTLRKESERRYRSAEELDEDIERYLKGLPIAARGDSTSYRVGKYVLRHRTAVTGAVLVLLSLLIGFVATSVAWRRARIEAERYQLQLYVSDMNLAFESLQNRQIDEAERIANRQIPAPGAKDVRGVEWGLLRSLTHRTPPKILRAHKGPVNELALVPGKLWVASVGEDAMIHIWDVESGDRVATMGPADGPLYAVAVSADASTVATGCEKVELWDMANSQRKAMLKSCPANVESLAFAPNRPELAVGVRYEDVSILPLDGGPSTVVHTSRSRFDKVTFMPDGLTLIFPKKIDDASVLHLWDCQANTVKKEFRGGSLDHMAASSDGRWLAATSQYETEMRIFDVNSGEQVYSVPRTSDGIRVLAFSPDASMLAGGCVDGTVLIWRFITAPTLNESSSAPVTQDLPDPVQMHQVNSFRADDSVVWSLLFVDNHRLATGGGDGSVKIWSVSRDQGIARHGPLNEGFWTASMIPKLGILAATGSDGTVWLKHHKNSDDWDTFATKPRLNNVVEFSPNEDLLAVAQTNGSIHLWETQDLRMVDSLPHGNKALIGLSFSRDGKWLASTGHDMSTCLWDLAERRLRHRWRHANRGFRVAFSPNSCWLAMAGDSREVRIMDVEDFQSRDRIIVSSNTHALAWSTDGRFLAAGLSNGEIILYALTDRSSTKMLGHQVAVKSLTFFPDGATLASGDATGTIRLWHVATGRPLGILHQTPQPTYISALFAPEPGDQLVATLSVPQEGYPILSWHVEDY